MTAYAAATEALAREPRRWLVSGAAGFIGSHLVETLLELGQHVVGLDNFETGSRRNLELLRAACDAPALARLTFVEADIKNYDACRQACESVDYVLHHAALGSVPRSIGDPVATNETNVSGTVNMLRAAQQVGVSRFVYASSSANYGDSPILPKQESTTGRPLSPYAASKIANELYAAVFQDAYGLECIGLRYFNVFGPRQDPDGAYAAVIPKWIRNLAVSEPCEIYGDGETSRDFCYIDNVVQANILAATCSDSTATNQIYNVACGERTTLGELFSMIRERVVAGCSDARNAKPVFRDFRAGDVRHSLAEIEKARRLLRYEPSHSVSAGLDITVAWFINELAGR